MTMFDKYFTIVHVFRVRKKRDKHYTNTYLRTHPYKRVFIQKTLSVSHVSLQSTLHPSSIIQVGTYMGKNGKEIPKSTLVSPILLQFGMYMYIVFRKQTVQFLPVCRLSLLFGNRDNGKS